MGKIIYIRWVFVIMNYYFYFSLPYLWQKLRHNWFRKKWKALSKPIVKRQFNRGFSSEWLSFGTLKYAVWVLVYIATFFIIVLFLILSNLLIIVTYLLLWGQRYALHMCSWNHECKSFSKDLFFMKQKLIKNAGM